VSKNLLFQVLSKRRKANAPYLVHLFDQVNYVDGVGQVVSSELTENLSDFDILETCTGIFLEKESGEFRPDVIVERADGRPIFLEVKVRHASSDKKKRNSIILEIEVSGESDFARLSDSLGEPRDLLVNFESFRHLVTRPAPAKSVLPMRSKTSRVEEMAALTEFDEAFKTGRLLARLPHDFDGLLGGGHRKRCVAVNLNEYYATSAVVENEDLVYLQLSARKGSRLRIGFDVRLKESKRGDHYIWLEAGPLSTSETLLDGIEDTDVLIRLGELKSNYLVEVACFAPRGHYASSYREYGIQEFRDLVEQDAIEVLSIVQLKKM